MSREQCWQDIAAGRVAAPADLPRLAAGGAAGGPVAGGRPLVAKWQGGPAYVPLAPGELDTILEDAAANADTAFTSWGYVG